MTYRHDPRHRHLGGGSGHGGGLGVGRLILRPALALQLAVIFTFNKLLGPSFNCSGL